MKKIFFITTIFIFLLSANSFALNFHADSAFTYLRSWTEPDKAPKALRTNSFGMFLGLGMTFQRDFTITLGGNFLGGKFLEEDMPPIMDDSELLFYRLSFEIEYAPYIPVLYNNRIKWFISFGCGYTNVEMEQNSSDPMTMPDVKDDDSGVPITIQTGLIVQAAQNFAPFVKIGWERIFYMDNWKEFENDSITLCLGVRFYFLPSRKINNTY